MNIKLFSFELAEAAKNFPFAHVLFSVQTDRLDTFLLCVGNLQTWANKKIFVCVAPSGQLKRKELYMSASVFLCKASIAVESEFLRITGM